MSRTISMLNAGLFTLALALPAAAASRVTSASDSPSCDGGPKGEKKDEKKNPSAADAECGGGPKTDDGKGDKKNPSNR